MIRTLMLCVLASASTASAAASIDVTAAKAQIDASLAKTYSSLEALYRDIHAHPELGFQETRTAALLSARMRALGFSVTEHVGKTGIVAVLTNGSGPTVLVRTELDALPMEEKTGLSYASKVQQIGEDGRPTYVDHACGHDIHMAWWVGTAQALATMRDRWHGTLIFIGQPAEETAAGAKAMLADGLFTRFPKPEYGFAAHVGPAPAGTVSVKQGISTSTADTILIRFKGAGAHGSMPDKSIDPIVEAAHFVTDVQAVISRQKDAQKFGVVTVGAFQAGTVANIIPDHADLQLSLRSYDDDVRKVLNDGVATTAKAVAAMANAPAPDIRHSYAVRAVHNDVVLAAETSAILKQALGDDRVTLVPETSPGWTASEDYSEFVEAGMPRSVLFRIGGHGAETLARYTREGITVPTNHSPFFAPTPEITIRTGVTTLTLAVLSVAGR